MFGKRKMSKQLKPIKQCWNMNYNGKYCWYINFICAPYWWFIVYLHRFIVCALLDLMIALSGSQYHHRIIHDSSIVIYRASIVICRLFIYSSFVDYVCLLFMVFVIMDDLIRCDVGCYCHNLRYVGVALLLLRTTINYSINVTIWRFDRLSAPGVWQPRGRVS